MCNRFWLLSKNLLTPPPILTDNIKLNGMPTKIKWKIQACIILYLKLWEGASVKSYKIQLPVLLSIVLQLFRTSLNIMGKRFLSQIFLFLQIHPNPSTFMAKICYSFVLNCQRRRGEENAPGRELSMILRAFSPKVFSLTLLLRLSIKE